MNLHDEHHISSYDELEEKLRSALASRNALKDRIRTAQSQMTEIRNQRNAILSYRKTKDIYTQYRESGWSPAFYREHKAEIEAPPATSEYMIKAVLGGMTIPVGADAILTAVANFRSYPSSTC